MNSFQVIIDYNYKLIENNFIGNGMRGQVYKYIIDGINYIIKYDNYMGTIEYRSIYSNSNQFTFDKSTNINFIEVIKKYTDMASIVNNLNHFVKIKGLVIFPNLSWERHLKTNIFYSVIYEYVGNLNKEHFLLNKENAIQLLEVFESFKQFNLAGYFHNDIQGCNNIEYNKYNKQLYVLDYDVHKIEDNGDISLNLIFDCLYKFITCIIRYQSNNGIPYDTSFKGNIAIDIMHEYLKNKPTILEKNSSKELKIEKMNGFYYQEHEFNKNINNLSKLLNTYNRGLFNNIEGEILYDINDIFAEYIEQLRSIRSITVDYNRFSDLLKNYIDNYYNINNFLNEIMNNNITDNEKQICSNIIKELHTICSKSVLLFIETTKIYFKDAKYIINSIYDKYIKEFNYFIISKYDNSNNNMYYQKYMKYKNKYLQLKNTN